MTTASTDAYAELIERERAWSDARDNARALSRDLAARVQASRQLQDERRRPIHREPGLVNHLGHPASKSNPIAKLDAEIAQLGDLQEAKAKAGHARELVGRARQSWGDFLAAHMPEILETVRPEGQAIAEAANAAIADAHEKVAAYLAFTQRAEGYTIGADPRRRNPRTVRGLDAASSMVRHLGEWDLEDPIP